MELPNILIKIPMSPIFYFLKGCCIVASIKRKGSSYHECRQESWAQYDKDSLKGPGQRGFQRLCRDKADIGTAEIQTEEKLKNQLATGPAEISTNIMVPDSLYNF